MQKTNPLSWWQVHRDEFFLSHRLRKPLRSKNFYHLVEFSPHPFLAGIRRLWFTSGVTRWCHQSTFGGWSRLMGLAGILFVMYVWWRGALEYCEYLFLSE